jgi:glucuronoarabinoxylan endo-1,4-beta-xylanase
VKGSTDNSVAKTRRLRYRGVVLLFLTTLLLGFALTRARAVVPITINWNKMHQTIDGFGASATGYTGTLTSAQSDKFFSPVTGIGLSLLRLRMIPDTLDLDCGCAANNTPYTCTAGSNSQIVTGDLQVARLAAARGVRLLASPWSPPAGMKSSGKYCTSGSMIGNSTNYAAYAVDLVSFPALLKVSGLSLDALSVQNEPDIENVSYDTATWTSQQIHDFVPYLSSALGGAGYGNVKIAIPEESGWTFELMNTLMDDPAVASDVGLILGHAYGVEKPTGIPATNGRHVWQTEAGNASHYDGSMKDALRWAQNIHNYMSISANAWMYWNLDCGPAFFNHDNNMCLTDQSDNFAKRAYVLGHYAKFIRPGWHRIDVTNSGSLLVTAYKGPENKFAIVAINKSRWAAREQTFALNGITSQRSPVTPWVTSASVSLQVQPATSLTSNGSLITYTIPSNSVVTFQGQAD